jgi:hypothetical protein
MPLLLPPPLLPWLLGQAPACWLLLQQTHLALVLQHMQLTVLPMLQLHTHTRHHRRAAAAHPPALWLGKGMQRQTLHTRPLGWDMLQQMQRLSYGRDLRDASACSDHNPRLQLLLVHWQLPQHLASQQLLLHGRSSRGLLLCRTHGSLLCCCCQRCLQSQGWLRLA